MDALSVTNQEYKEIVASPFSLFDSAEFIELNKHKVDCAKYFIFNNGKNRLALVGGLKGDELKFPFSASFSCFSEVKDKACVEYYDASVKALVNWAKDNNVKKIKFNLPPYYYGTSVITKLQNSLENNQFKSKCLDMNFEYYLDNFDDNYLYSIQRGARKNYQTAVENQLVFEKTQDLSSVYNTIKQNRDEKGYPLWMSQKDVEETAKIIKSDYFIVKNKEGVNMAAALCHHFGADIIRVVYWGHLNEFEQIRPLNFLSYNLFKYYKTQNKKIIDIGPSTDDGVPNFGLCNFKENIGCDCSPKFCYEWSV